MVIVVKLEVSLGLIGSHRIVPPLKCLASIAAQRSDVKTKQVTMFFVRRNIMKSSK